jgi:signal peptidase II
MGRVLLTRRRIITWTFVVASAVVVIDQLTKALVRANMEPGESIPVLEGIFHLTYVRNIGAAFGLMPGNRVMFMAVAVVVLVGVSAYMWIARPQSRVILSGLGLVVGGAIGNFIDRFGAGRVTDFFDFQVFAVFNVADSCIVVGVALLMIWGILWAPKEAEDGHLLSDADSGADAGESA